MQATPADDCPHDGARPMGLTDRVPEAWFAGTHVPNDGAQHESAWCQACQRYLWRALGGTHWTALTRAAP